MLALKARFVITFNTSAGLLSFKNKISTINYYSAISFFKEKRYIRDNNNIYTFTLIKEKIPYCGNKFSLSKIFKTFN